MLLSNGRVWYTVLHLHCGQWYGPFGEMLHKSPMHRWQNRWLHFRVTGSPVCSLHRGHTAGVSNDAPILFLGDLVPVSAKTSSRGGAKTFESHHSLPQECVS